jgi:hypothetical protein
MLIHEIYGIDQFSQFLHDLARGIEIKLAGIEASLELMLKHFTYDLQLRSYCQQEYGLDEPCLLLITGGRYSTELKDALRKFDLELQSTTDYVSSRSAIKQILGVDFGTYAYNPFIRILAPIDLKISESDIKDNRLTFLLTASDLIQLKDIRVALQGYDDKGQTTDFSKNIREFKRQGKQQVFQPISIELPAYSLYVKLVLYYKNLITLKNIEYKSEEILSQVTEVVSQDSVLERKRTIQVLYDNALKAKKAFDKGRLLEEVISKLIELVPGLKVVKSRVYDGIHELDLLVRNFNRDGVWADFEGMILVECKNWSKPAGSSEIDSFYTKLRNKHSKIGLFISIKDITGEKMKDARGQVMLCLQEGYKIIIINGNDIKEILNCKDLPTKIDEKYIGLYT